MQSNNYSDYLRLRSHEFYANVLKNERKSSEKLQTILRSNSSLSLDQKSNQRSVKDLSINQSIDFKDFQELRECRFLGDTRTTSTTSGRQSTTPAKTVMAKKSRTIHSIHSQLSVSNENLAKNQTKSGQKAKTKSLFFGKSSLRSDFCEEKERKRRLRRLFLHYDIQSALSLDQLFDDRDDDTKTTPDRQSSSLSSSSSESETEENEFNSNSLLGFSENFRNEIGREEVFCIQLNGSNCSKETTNDRQRRRPLHCPSLGRQLSCVSSFDVSSDVNQSSLLSSKVCSFDSEYEFKAEKHLLELDFGNNYYRKYFYGFNHKNFFCVHRKLAVALSLRKDSKDLKKLRIILRTNRSLVTFKGFLNLNCEESRDLDLSLRSVFLLLFPSMLSRDEKFFQSFRLGFDSKSDELLLKFDELLENNCFKIGILYAKGFQSTEEDFYNNKDIKDEDFQRFLALIGTKVRLKGYKGFRGGLDVTTDTTGLFTYCTRFRERDIVYHVMNELPFSPNNKQQLLRKRHIGNDIITLVFQSKAFKGKPFNPSNIRSHFQHVFIVVRPFKQGYKVAVARHKDVPPFGPPLKPYYSSEEFREFLLSKAVNAETACHKCAKFRQMALRTRFEYLNDLYENYSSPTTVTTLLSSNQSSLSSVSSTQQLIQFSQNFNKYFAQIFTKNSQKSQKSVENKQIIENQNELKTIFSENELFFGAKVYESTTEKTTEVTTETTTEEEINCRLSVHSFQESRDLETRVKVLLNQNFLIVLNKKKTIFVLNLKQILGFLLQNCDQKRISNGIELQFKIFFHQGELLLLKEKISFPYLLDSESMNALIEKNSILFELKSDLISKIAFNDLNEDNSSLRTRQMRQLILQRALFGDKSFGFHIQSQNNSLFVTEVNEHALKVNQLRRGQRLLELCHLATISLKYQEVLDFLKTSQSVSVSVVQPLSDGKPRNDECFQRNCFKKFSQKSIENQNDYENIATVTTPTTLTTVHRPEVSSKSPMRTTYRPTTATTVTQSPVVVSSPLSSSQRPLHLKPALTHNQNHSSQSSTTSSTLQEDLIKLLTINDDIDDTTTTATTTTTTADDRQTTESSLPTTDSHSSSRYSTATSTPYSSLERRQRRHPSLTPTTPDDRRRPSVPSVDDCVLTVAKPAFVVNSVNELGFGRQKTTEEDLEEEFEEELTAFEGFVASNASLGSISGSESNDSQLKEQVKELSQEKQRLNETIRQLKEENQRLHFESQTASQQLRKFTEWFFSSNQK